MCWLCPIKTTGVPGMLTPDTSKPGDVIEFWNQIAGRVRCRCGSPARSAPPLALREPLTAQLLLAPKLDAMTSSDASLWWIACALAATWSVIVIPAIDCGCCAFGYGPGSYGDCWFGGRIGNHSFVR